MIGELYPGEKGIIESMENFEEFLSGIRRGLSIRVFSYRRNGHDRDRK